MNPVRFQLSNGKMVQVSEPRLPHRANFVICCDHGDWSGFRTLAECQKQFAELEQIAKLANKPEGYYWVEER